MLATHIPHFVHPIRAVWLLLRRADIATSVRTRECLSGDHCFAHVPHVVALRAESEAKAGSKSSHRIAPLPGFRRLAAFMPMHFARLSPFMGEFILSPGQVRPRSGHCYSTQL